MPGPWIPRPSDTRINPHRWCDNEQVVSSSLEYEMIRKLNAAARYRRKEVFRYVGQVVDILSSIDADGPRWRFAFRTGVLARRLVVRAVMARHNGEFGTGDAFGTDDPYATFALDGVSSVDLNFGGGIPAAGNDPADTFDEFGYPRVTLDVSPNTDYTATFTDVNGARLISASVHEEAVDATTGYIEGTTPVLSPIYDVRRERMLPMMDDLWRYNAAHGFNFTVDVDSDVRFMTNSNAARNLIDNTTTGYADNVPGFKLDLRYKNRRHTVGDVDGPTVPCVLRVFGNADTAGRPGAAYLLSSSGTVATVTIGHYSDDDTGAWWSTLVDLPATEAKYDIHFAGYGSSSPSNRTYVYAASLYEFDGPVPSAPASGSVSGTAFGNNQQLPRFNRRLRRRRRP